MRGLCQQYAGLPNLSGQLDGLSAQVRADRRGLGQAVAQPLHISLRLAEERDALVGIACARPREQGAGTLDTGLGGR